MANLSLNEFTSKQQLEYHEMQRNYLSQAEAMIQVALSREFLEFSEHIVHDYLWALSDVIKNARKFNEHSLNFLVRNECTV